MITCKEDTSRICSCDNCNRITPFILEYKFIDVNEDGKETPFSRIHLCEDCSNAIVNLFHSVMENGKSFKYVKDEIKEFEEEIQMKDKTINLCETCNFCFADCANGEEGIDFNFGTGLGLDNVYECKNYNNESEEI